MKSPTRWVRPSDLEVVFEVQREAVEAWIHKLKDSFDPRAVGVLYVSQRPDGRLVVIDGQHRLLALHTLGNAAPLPCFVYTGLTTEDECELFLQLNNRRNVTAVDKFRIGVGAGIEECVGVNDLLIERGLKIAGDRSRNGAPPVSCAAVMRSYWKRAPRERTGPQALACALDTAVGAFGTSGDALHGVVVAGLSELYLENAWVETAALIDRLAKAGGPALLLGRAKALYALHKGSSLGVCMWKVCGDVYNQRRSATARVKVPF